LSKELLFLGLPLLFLLFITRESTIVIAFILFGLLLYRKRRAEAISVAAVCIVAMAIIHLTTRNLPENIHNVTPLQYMILKVPYNLAIHFFGLRLWTNTHIWSDPPIWKVVLPHWLAIGNIREIGFLRFELLTPLRTLTTALTIGGIFMPLCWWHLRRSFSKILSTCDLWLSTALIYGLCSWLLAPSLGALVTKYYDSSWPAFCLAGPILLERYFDNKRKLIILLILGNLMYWIPSLLDLFGFLPKSQI
jgi:hypothetical protein